MKKRCFLAAMTAGIMVITGIIFASCPTDSGGGDPVGPVVTKERSTRTYTGKIGETDFSLTVYDATIPVPSVKDEYSLDYGGKTVTGTVTAVDGLNCVLSYGGEGAEKSFNAVFTAWGGLSIPEQEISFEGGAESIRITAMPAGWEGPAIIDDDPSNPVPANWNVDTRTLKVSRNGKPILNTVWGEGYWQDPRIVLGYKFQGGPLDGKLWFDRYVQLYGGRLANHDCANDPLKRTLKLNGVDTLVTDDHCTKTGLHLHLDKQCYDILEGRNTYIKPLQEAGIKFLIGLVPNDGGVAHGTLYSWPFEDVAPWKEIYKSDPEYPFGERAVASLVNDIKEIFQKYGIDGIGFDDEYGCMKGMAGAGLGAVYPSNNTSGYVYYNNNTDLLNACDRGGYNMFRFIYDLRKAIPGIILEDYEIRYGSYIPASMDIVDEGGTVYYGKKEDFPETVRSKARTIQLTDYVDASYYVYYGIWKSKNGLGHAENHMPRSRYGPLPMDIGASSTGQAAPYGNAQFLQQMQDFTDQNFGVLMYYALYNHDGYNTANYFGAGKNKPEDYFTLMAGKIFYDDAAIVYEGDDYKLPWN